MKYKRKEPPRSEMQEYIEICINCGDTRIVTWPKALPIPNMTEYMGKPSWFNCKILKDHYYYPASELELA